MKMFFQNILLISSTLLIVNLDLSFGRQHCQTYDVVHHKSSIDSWNKARNYCKNRGMDLVKIDNKDEDAFLRSILRSDTGGSRNEGWYIGGKMVNGQWKWADGSRMNYKNFPGLSAFSPDANNYAAILLNDLGTWVYLSPWSNNKVGFICESNRC